MNFSADRELRFLMTKVTEMTKMTKNDRNDRNVRNDRNIRNDGNDRKVLKCQQLIQNSVNKKCTISEF